MQHINAYDTMVWVTNDGATAATVHGIHLKDHQTAGTCITLEEYHRRVAAEKEENAQGK